MYRGSTDQAIVYTAEDLILFRESPFASWMERMTLENPNHGISPDPGSLSPHAKVTRWQGGSPLPAAGIVQSMGWLQFVHVGMESSGETTENRPDQGHVEGMEGCDIAIIEPSWGEPRRRSATLAAMQRGAAVIANGQLAEAMLSDSVDLLIRNTGFSAFGNYLYTPCHVLGQAVAETELQARFRLCYFADLLESVQKSLPLQMLLVGCGGNILPLQTLQYIYHYRAVKQRFVQAQRTFRKHRMPDPSESSHFGRWSDCANALLKQRAMTIRRHTAVPKESGDNPGPVVMPVDRRSPESAVSSAAPERKLSSRPLTDDEPSRKSWVDLDTPLATEAKRRLDPHLDYRDACEPDGRPGERGPRPFDSTLKTSGGLGW